MGLLIKQCAEQRKALFLYCCIQVWMKIGGRNSLKCYCSTKHSRSFFWWKDFTWKANRKTIYLTGQLSLFGTMVGYRPTSSKDFSRLHQFGPEILPSVFLGYVFCAGRIERDGCIRTPHPKAQCKGSVNIIGEKKFIFPIADGRIKISGKDQDLRTSTLIRDNPKRGEEHDIPRGNHKRLFQFHEKTHHGMMVKSEAIFGLSQEISFTVITWNPDSNCTCQLKDHSLFHWHTLTSPEILTLR